MREIRPWDWMRSVVAGLAFALVLAGSPLVGMAPRLQAADAATPMLGTDVSADDLKAFFLGRNPAGVADLRAMQLHVQKLTETLSKCTVGVQVGNAQGSGVIISKDGYVLTAAHVAGEPNKRVRFMLSDGNVVAGKTLGLCRTLDAGLMKITDPGEYPHAEMGSSTGLKEGQWCLALGHPGGYQSDRGAVLRLGRVLFRNNDVITTDCTLVGGDSGGPLFDMDGKVIGINSRIASSLDTNMHAPVGAFQESWDRLTGGEAWGHYPGQKPWIGVQGEEGAKGAKLANVGRRSPADRAGLKAGDVIVKFDGQDLADFKALAEAVAARAPGDRVTIVVERGEELIEKSLTIGRG
jgi:serine protease Do